MERQTGITPEQLIPVPIPYEVEYLWGWFREMNSMRVRAMEGVSPLCTEILTWQSLESTTLTPFELDTIRQLDAMFIKFHSKKEPE